MNVTKWGFNIFWTPMFWFLHIFDYKNGDVQNAMQTVIEDLGYLNMHLNATAMFFLCSCLTGEKAATTDGNLKLLRLDSHHCGM